MKELAFVLTRIVYCENKFILHLFGESSGLIQSVMRIKNTKNSKDIFLYQPGDLLEIEQQKKETSQWTKLISFSLISSNQVIKSSYLVFLFQTFLFELIWKISTPNESTHEVFKLLKIQNKIKWNKEKRSFIWINWFLFRFISIYGIKIQWEKCLNCFKSSWNEDRIHPKFRKMEYCFEILKGGFICKNCKSNIPSEFLIDASFIKICWLLENQININELPLNVPSALIYRVFYFLCSYISQNIHYNIKSKELLLDFYKSSIKKIFKSDFLLQ